MSQPNVEIVVGRLLTDEAFRRAFLQWPLRTLRMLEQCGLEFSEMEVSALVRTDRLLWSLAAQRLDPRLHHERRILDDDGLGPGGDHSLVMD
jgi:hypothetical protein